LTAHTVKCEHRVAPHNFGRRETFGAARGFDPIKQERTMPTFILIALLAVFVLSGRLLIYICIGYVDYFVEERRRLTVLREATSGGETMSDLNFCHAYG